MQEHKNPSENSPTSQTPLRLGISQCLMGEKVRYDGAHKRNGFLLELFAPYVEWHAVCPEVEVGMGIPRETLHLVGDPEAPLMQTTKTKIDHTDSMNRWSQERLDTLECKELHGYIFKKNSPSCGLFGVKVFPLQVEDSGSTAAHTGESTEEQAEYLEGRGLFASAFTDRFPLLPVEEEERLQDPVIRDHFISQLVMSYRWKTFLEGEVKPHGLISFHRDAKMTLLAHSPVHYKSMGKMLSNVGKDELPPLLEAYGQQLMEAMKVPASRGKHVNVIQHLIGFVSKKMAKAHKQEWELCLQQYQDGLCPRLVPLTLLQHHIRHGSLPAWVSQQFYLAPLVFEQMLQNPV